MAKNTVKPKDIKPSWFVVDVRDVVLGRAATKIASILMGKTHPYYSPQWDMGDNVIVVNAEQVLVTGQKESKKVYYRHSGFPGGLKSQTLAEVRKTKPEQLLIQAVKGMLPKNRLQSVRLSKLHVYAGAEHPHVAQKPEQLAL